MKFKTPIEVQAGNSYLDGKVYINARASIPNRPEEFQVTGTQIITDTGTSNPSLYIGYNSSGANTVQLGRGRTADGLSYIDFNGEVMAAGDFGFRIMRGAGVNATTDLIQVGTGSLIINAQNGADTIFTNTDVGIGTTSPSAKLDIINSGLGTMFRLSNTEANATTKYGAILGRHYTNAEENVTGMLITSNSSATGGTVSIGGGISVANAVNNVLFYTAANNTTLTGTERMRINQAGNVGIGAINPSSGIGSTRILKVESTGNSEVNVDHRDGGTSSDIGLFSFSRNGDHLAHMKATHDGATNSAFMSFHTQQTGGSFSNASSNERMRITSIGDVGIGTTAPIYELDVNGDIRARGSIYVGTYGARLNNYLSYLTTNSEFRVGYGGGAYATCRASAFTVTSDYRLKEKIVPLTDSLDRLRQLNVYKFNWIDKPNEEPVDGFIAHEVAEVIPEAVVGVKDEIGPDGKPEYQGLDQAKIVPLLTAALQESITKIEQLEQRIQTLENK